jgi:hypothetical protein
MTAGVALTEAEVDGGWLRPTANSPAEPRWGHPDGLQVGLPPLPGPRGLLRIYAPHVGHAAPKLINFIAVEPVPVGERDRGFSELERSAVDGAAGKLIWTADPQSPDEQQPIEEPARGRVDVVDGVERLRILFRVERFDNGAEVDVFASFRADRPDEVSLSSHHRPGSAPLAHSILTATMGNYARLRQLHLADRIVTPRQLWPDFDGDHFAPHARFALSDITRTPEGAALVTATTDEASPTSARYTEGTREHWRYTGPLAEQSWRVPDPDPGLEVLVNARAVYWASTSPIPGGPSFENFEIVEPYRAGREYVFGVRPAASRPA